MLRRPARRVAHQRTGGPPRRAAAGGHRRQAQGRQEHAAQWPGRRGAGAHRRQRVHAHRHVVRRRADLSGHTAPRRRHAGADRVLAPERCDRRRPTGQAGAGDRADRRRVAVVVAHRVVTDRHARHRLDLDRGLGAHPEVRHRRRRPREPGRRHRLSDAPPPPDRRPFPRSVPGLPDRPHEPDQRRRRAVARRRAGRGTGRRIVRGAPCGGPLSQFAAGASVVPDRRARGGPARPSFRHRSPERFQLVATHRRVARRPTRGVARQR